MKRLLCKKIGKNQDCRLHVKIGETESGWDDITESSPNFDVGIYIWKVSKWVKL